MPSDCSNICLVITALILPPLAAMFVGGCCDVIINILLTILGFIPGLVHALWLVYRKNEAERSYGPSGYIYVGNGHFEPRAGQGPVQGHPQQPYPQQQQYPQSVNAPQQPYEAPTGGYGTMAPPPQHKQAVPPTYGQQAKH